MLPKFYLNCFRKSDLFSFAANISPHNSLLDELHFTISISLSSSIQVNGSYFAVMNFQDEHIHTPQILFFEYIFKH